MRSDLVRRDEVMKSLTNEYNIRFRAEGIIAFGGLHLAWIEKAVDDVKPAQSRDGWIRIDPDLPMEEQMLPDDDTYVLLSFSNSHIPAVGRCKKDEEGCSFFIGVSDIPLASIGIIVNGWMPLPKCLEDDDEDD